MEYRGVPMGGKLVICGTYRPLSLEELSPYDEVWSVGKSTIPRADRFFEFHDLPCREPCYRWKDLPKEELLHLHIPLTNSICIMLGVAILEGHTDITILASPLCNSTPYSHTINVDYAEQRPAVAYIIGLASVQGISITWEGGPDFETVYQWEVSNESPV
jgi:hypothetical protein